jgi:hypothetical protein
MDVPDDTTELWRPLPDWETIYEVSSCGRVRTIKTGRTRKLSCDTNGYHVVHLCDRERKRTVTVHVKVMTAFGGSRPYGMQVNHKSGVKTDDAFSNLEWTTCLENVRHAKSLGLTASGDRNGHRKHPESWPHDFSKGVNNPHSKLNDNEVRYIKRILSGTVRRGTMTALARRYSVRVQTIYKIKIGESWTHIFA